MRPDTEKLAIIAGYLFCPAAISTAAMILLARLWVRYRAETAGREQAPDTTSERRSSRTRQRTKH